MCNRFIVKGRIIIDSDIKSFSGATIFVRLKDATFADTYSKLVSEQIIKNVNYDIRTPNQFDFELYAENLDDKADYIIEVHIDVDGNGIVSSGDFINMESYPVISHGFPRDVSIKVKELK
jgi:uncharacterized lipoprotein YbaY